MTDGWATIGSTTERFANLTSIYILGQTSRRGKGLSDPHLGDDYTNFLERGSAGSYAQSLGMDQLPYWKDVTDHPSYDAFWQAQALDKMIVKIQASGAKLLLVGMLAPTNWGEEYKRAFDAIYPELARIHRLPLYPFFLEGVLMKPELNQPDGIHPSERGVAVIVDKIAPMVARLIGSQS